MTRSIQYNYYVQKKTNHLWAYQSVTRKGKTSYLASTGTYEIGVERESTSEIYL